MHHMHDIIHDVKEACKYLEDVIEEIVHDDTPHSLEATEELVMALQGLKAAMKVKHMYAHMMHHPDHAMHDMSSGKHHNPAMPAHNPAAMHVAPRDKHAEIAAKHNPY